MAKPALKKTKKVAKEVIDPKHRLPKVTKNVTPILAVTKSIINPRADIAAFYVKRISDIEGSTHLVSNIAKYLDPVSTGFLTLDWLFGGGFFNVFASVSGPEGSSKSTAVDHTIASNLRTQALFNIHIDAESTMNAEYAAAKFALSGINYGELELLKHKPYRYYRENIIETIFDYMHQLLKSMPQKIWVPDANSWAYVFNKNDKTDAALMAAYGVTPEKSLSRRDKFVCLTEYSGIEAGFFLDSFAAMVTNSDDEEDKKSKRRAAEASAFSEHLRRISARLSNRGALMLGVNQLRKIPNVQGRQDPNYEPGGEALKFFSAQRGRFNSVGSGMIGNDAEYKKEFKRMAEPSVIVPGTFDLYDYKSIKNTKNKPGNPGKSSMMRVWVADHAGNGHGYDPAYDVFNYLMETNQLIKDRRKLTFNLRKSAGPKRAELLNSLPTFTEADLKRLTLSEVFNQRELTKAALDGMGLTKTVGLREALLEQVRTDKKIIAIKTSTKKNDDDEDMEDGSVEY